MQQRREGEGERLGSLAMHPEVEFVVKLSQRDGGLEVRCISPRDRRNHNEGGEARREASAFALQSWGMEANLRCAAADDVGNCVVYRAALKGASQVV